MIPQQYINSVLGEACASFGYPVTNAAFYRQVVPIEITDQQLISKCEELIAAQNVPASPIDLAEQWIYRFFSTGRLLQMKVWWDTFPHEDTPKLAAIYQWSDSVTRMAAIEGETIFPEPPYDFQEVTQECLSIAQNG